MSIERRAWRTWPRPRGLWCHRDFLLLWSAQGISAVGSRITRTGLPVAAIPVASAGALDGGLLAVTLTFRARYSPGSAAVGSIDIAGDPF